MDKILTYLRTGQHPGIRAINSQGGALLPLTMAEKIHERASVLYPLTGLLSMDFVNSNKVNIPFYKSGVSLSWLEEGTPYTPTSMEMDGVLFRLKKTAASFKVSEETILDSAFDIEGLLVETFAHDLGQQLEDVYINGDGIGKPAGFLDNCTKIPAAGAALTYTDVKALFDTLGIEYMANSAWLIAKETFSLLSETTTTGGNPVIQLNDSQEPGAPGGYILSRPCYITAMPTDYPLAFGAFNNYKVLQTIPVVQRLHEKYANTGYTGFLMRGFIDGHLLKPESVIALSV